MKTEQKKTLRKLLIGGSALLVGVFLGNKFLTLAAYLWLAWEIIIEAGKNLLQGKVLDEIFLMSIASLCAIALGEYIEAASVMFFFELGEFLEELAEENSRHSITALLSLRPNTANVLENGELHEVPSETVAIGSLIVVKPGERIPLDGIITAGTSALDTSALTGESIPVDVKMGSEVFSGSVNLNGILTVRINKAYKDSAISRIMELVENSDEKKASSEHFIRKFAKFYTPSVVIAALLVAVIPPLCFKAEWNNWIHRSLNFLVISCPCALVISVPLSFFSGIGAASKKGILIKGSSYLEMLTSLRTMVFDKTGTLTKGVFAVSSINPSGIERESLLEYAASAESLSNHPIAGAILRACPTQPVRERIRQIEEIPGKGIRALIDDKTVLAGNGGFLESEGISIEENCSESTTVYLAIDGKFAGSISVSDTIKEEAAETIHTLREQGVGKIVMLTGDKTQTAARVAKQLNLDSFHAELMPQNKAELVEEMKKEMAAQDKLAFVGDGINDAPVLLRADIGIAMGALGSDAAIESADIVLMDDKLNKINTAIHIAEKTMRIVHENIVLAIGIKLLILVLATIGYDNLLLAAFADVGVTVLAVLNAMRAGK